MRGQGALGMAKVEAIVDDAASRLRLPSVAVGVSLAGEEGFSVAGHRAFLIKPADADTVYRIGSCSKAFIAASVLLLQEEGRLDIDSPVVGYLPGLRFYNEELTAQVTPRDMLCHRTGLPRHDIASFANQQRTLAQMAEAVRYLEPAYGLRERFHYQNHMYGVLSLLVEAVSGQPWGQFVQERILGPLGMARTFTRCGAQWQADDDYARSLTLAGRANIPFINSNDDSTGGAGSISASIRDLLAWVRLNLGRGRFQGREVLPEAVFAEMHRPQMAVEKGEASIADLPFVSDTSYGMGWYLQRYHGEPLVVHGGVVFGFRAMVGFLPGRGFAFAVLANQNDTVACDAIARSLCDAVLGEAPYDWVSACRGIRDSARAKKQEEIKRLTAPSSEAVEGEEGLVGYYEHPAYGRCQVRRRAGRLVLSYAGLNLRLKPRAAGGFVVYSKLANMAFPCRFEGSGQQAAALSIKLDEDLGSFIRFDRTEPPVGSG